ncbi:MAG: hypothetical protein JXA82_09755, partial [Sedimentisphaerales bacterium]|nr:hypothetical protein [Sedimentisphaerales bacterium]
MKIRNWFPYICLTLIAFSCPLFAYDDKYWSGSFGGNWSDTENWFGGEPSIGDSAYINHGWAMITEPDEYVHYNLYVGQYDDDEGGIVMEDGDLYVGYAEYIGSAGIGQFTHNDGIHRAMMGLIIGRLQSSQGTYELAGGELHSSYCNVAENGTGTFIQEGGIHTCGTLRISDITSYLSSSADGIYEIYGGTLTASSLTIAPDDYPGTFSIQGHRANITITGPVTFGPQSLFLVVPNSCIRITRGGDVINHKINSSDLSGLSKLNLVFDADGETSDLEVAGRDMGNVPEGFYHNFMLDTLTVGDGTVTTVILRDAIDNGHRLGTAGEDEALYIRKLIVRSGCTLNLNNLHLYCQESQIELGATVRNGTPEIVPQTPDCNGDGYINLPDLEILAEHWFRTDCDGTDSCEGADIVIDGTVNLRDFALLGEYWQGNETGVIDLLIEDFNDDNADGWTVHDTGDQLAPSAWGVAGGILYQTSHIYSNPTSPETLLKDGTYLG